ncbi:MAG: hypothetical protein GXP26_08225 [Planctomycetes bacterium]|nr:hypothetical protein [Planctomycetota bacterium]
MNCRRLSIEKSAGGMLCLLVLLGASGCQPRAAGELLGRWEGHPDTAAARAEREKKKYGQVPGLESAEDKTTDTVSSTDWEQYDVTVHFDFQSAHRLEMSLEGNGDILAGDWHIIASTPAVCTIEVTTDPPTSQTGSKTLAEEEPRRFDLELDRRDGECVGFLLSEAGADRQLGTLYFRRAPSP